jgi:alanine dehydrogenase
MSPLLLSEDDVESVLDMSENLQALESAYLQEAVGEAAYRAKANVYVGAQWGRSMTHVTSLGGLNDPPVVVLNIRSMVQEYEEHRDYQGTRSERKPGGTYMTMLFSGESGELLALMSNGLISWYRHGGTAGLAAREAALPGARVAGILGSGATARAHALAYAAVRPLELFKIYSPTPANRHDFARWLTEQTGVESRAVDSAEDAVRGSQIVAACTSYRYQSVVQKDWLEPGVHFTAVQTGEGGMELEPSALPLFQRLITSFDSAASHHPTGPTDSLLRTATTEETLAVFDVIPNHHTIVDVLSKKAPGRESAEERNYFVNNGTGVQYAATAALVYAKARERGVGTEMPEEWFRWFQR